MKTLSDIVGLGNIYYLSSTTVACEIGGIHLVFIIIEFGLEKAGLLLFWFDDHNHNRNYRLHLRLAAIVVNSC